MNSILPVLTGLLLLSWAGSSAGQGSAPPRAAATQTTQVAVPAAAELLARAQKVLATHRSIDAKVRQQIHLFDQEIFGSGRYLQQGAGAELMMRFELRLQIAGQESTLLQVADGRYLWTDRQLNGGRTVTRVDTKQVRQQLGQALAALPAGWPQLGGLQELLAGLATYFEFEPVVAGELAGVPIYTLTGKLRAADVAKLAAAEASDPAKAASLDPQSLPEQMPNEVVVILGRDDLFPYLVDYRRVGGAGEGAEEAPPAKSILRLQLFEVRLDGPVDLRQFVYKPGPVGVEDKTDALVEQLRVRQGLPKSK